MSKIDEAKEILNALQVPTKQQNPKSYNSCNKRIT